MSIVPFDRGRRSAQPCAAAAWRPHEMAELMRLYAALHGREAAVDYEFGETERGDPQFYVLGSDLEHPCLVAATRLAQGSGAWYVVEDGRGGVLFEGASLQPLVDAAACRWRAGRGRLAVIVSALLGIVGAAVAGDDDGNSGLTIAAAAALLDGSALAEGLLRWVPQFAAA